MAIRQWVSQSAAANSAPARELHNAITVGPSDHDDHRRRPHQFDHGRHRFQPRSAIRQAPRLPRLHAAELPAQVEFTGRNLPLLCASQATRACCEKGSVLIPTPAVDDRESVRHRIVSTAATAGADVAHVYAGSVTPGLVNELHGLGLTVQANDAVSVEDMMRALEAWADRISANDDALATTIAKGRRSDEWRASTLRTRRTTTGAFEVATATTVAGK